MKKCIVCGEECKNKFCSISCRNVYWNPKLKTGLIVNNPGHFKKLQRIEHKLNCITCGKEFTQLLTSAQINNKHRITCSLACAKSHSHSDETNNKIRQAVIKSNIKKGIIKNISWICNLCGKSFIKSRKSKYCSIGCVKQARRKNAPELSAYRVECKFKFNPYKFPEILDISLLTKYGFYSPINKKNNLGGVSMDHKLSIVDGFKSNIDPYYMSHIMNCQLMIHNKNIGKGSKSTITADELKRLVDNYDNRLMGQ